VVRHHPPELEGRLQEVVEADSKKSASANSLLEAGGRLVSAFATARPHTGRKSSRDLFCGSAYPRSSISRSASPKVTHGSDSAKPRLTAREPA